MLFSASQFWWRIILLCIIGASFRDLSKLLQNGSTPFAAANADEEYGTDPDEFDPEEFENIPTNDDTDDIRDSSEDYDNSIKFMDPKEGKQPAPKAEMYYPEIATVIFLVIYIINLYNGSSKNQAIADCWYNSVLEDVVRPQFTKAPYWQQVTGTLDGASQQIKDSNSAFRYYASGRRNCKGLLSKLELVKRHDLFSLMLGYAADLAVTQDTVTIEIPMLKAKMDPFVFVLFPSKDETMWRKKLADMTTYASKIRNVNKRIPQHLTCYTDAPDIIANLIPNDLKRCLETYKDELLLMHFTDSYNEPQPQVLRFIFALPTHGEKDMDHMQKAIRMCLCLIDRVAETRLSAAARQKCEQKRKKVREHKMKSEQRNRQEEYQRRRDEDPTRVRRKRRSGAPKMKFMKG